MTRHLKAWWPTVVFAVGIVVAYRLLSTDESVLEGIINTLVYGAFSITGGWIALRSGNPMGRLFQALALAAVGLFLTDSYIGSYVANAAFTLPDGGLDLVMVWANNLLFVPFFVLSFVLPFFLFPTGRPSSRRWSYVLYAIAFWAVAVTVATLVAPIVELDDGTVTNPWLGSTMQPAHASLWLRSEGASR